MDNRWPKPKPSLKPAAVPCPSKTTALEVENAALKAENERLNESVAVLGSAETDLEFAAGKIAAYKVENAALKADIAALKAELEEALRLAKELTFRWLPANPIDQQLEDQVRTLAERLQGGADGNG